MLTLKAGGSFARISEPTQFALHVGEMILRRHNALILVRRKTDRRTERRNHRHQQSLVIHMATRSEVTKWFESGISDEQLITIILEWSNLKNAACHRFAVATGADDWVDRFITYVRDMQDANAERKVLIREVAKAVIEHQQRLAHRPCRNCQGEKIVNDSTCGCCGGTGEFNL